MSRRSSVQRRKSPERAIEALDHALWAGLRALEENSELRQRMAKHARDRGLVAIASGSDEQAAESEQRAQVIRRVLMPEGPDTAGTQPVGVTADGLNRSRRTK